MINHPELLAALTKDFLNVYIYELEKNEATVVKLQGYVTKGLEDSPKVFSYREILENYISTRVYIQDRDQLRKALSPESLKEAFSSGREKFEVDYRALIDSQIHYFSAVYIRLSEEGAPLRLLVGFRNIDDTISLQNGKRTEGLIEAYNALSDLYLVMYRVSLRNDTFKVIKDSPIAKGYVKSNKFSENSLGFARLVSDPDTKESMEAFLDMSTIEERMKGKQRISLVFSNPATRNKFRLSFIREDLSNNGDIHHLIYAVEALEEDLYQSAFDVFTKELTNVFRVDPRTGIATILKAEPYIVRDFDTDATRTFHWENVLARYVKERIHPEDRAASYENMRLQSIEKALESAREHSGNYRVVEGGKISNFHYSFHKSASGAYIIAGFRNIDSFLKEHLEQEKKEKEIEMRHRKEMEEQLSLLNALIRNFRNVYLANYNDGSGRILKIDENYPVAEIQSLKDKVFPFEPAVRLWASKYVHEEDRENIIQVMSLDNIRKQFATKREITGNYRSVERGALHYYQYVIVKIDDDGRLVCGFQIIDDIIAEHLREEKERRAKEEILQKEREERSELIGAVATIYSTIFNVLIPTHGYEILNSVAKMGEVAARKGRFDDAREQIIEAFIAPDMRKEVNDFLNLDTLPARLEKANTIIQEYRNPEGVWFEARFIVKKRDEQGKAIEALYVTRDISAEKSQELRQEAALRDALLLANHASRAKTTFLNSMSHDIRTPMNAIIGFTALAEAHLDNKEAVGEYLSKIHTSSAHLLSLINEILDMSRIESGTVKLDESSVHLPDVLHDLRTIIQGQINSKGQYLYIDAIEVRHEDVITDKLRLSQVLINIAGNAIKYTPAGGKIAIRLSELPSNKEGYATYRFAIKDNGIGMSSEFKDKVFDAFSRERTSTVSGIQGTGLGMSITKNIVDLMGGSIEVESEQGKGSEFTVQVDFKLAEKEISNDPIPELVGERALVVDDDIVSCQGVCALLRQIEIRAEWTTSGKEAIIRAKEAKELGDGYKVCIVDYLMPDLNGIETIRQIRRAIGDEPTMIILSAYDWSEIEEEAKEAGVTAFLAKPIFASDLRLALSGKEVEAEEEEEETKVDCAGKKALLVEDNDLNREIARSILKDMGMEVDEAKDGIEAVSMIAKADENRYNIVFMDIQMPRMDGYTATREIRTFKNNRKANLPIFAMTANAFEEDRQKAFEAGMNGHIAKPIDAKSIAKAIAPFMNK